MIDHSEYKRSLVADPQNPSDAMRAHSAACHECAEFTARVLGFEGRLERALRVDVAGLPGDRVVPLRRSAGSRHAGFRGSRRGWLALAASLLVALILGGGLWLGSPRSSLAADVITHMSEEPDAWRKSETPVERSKLAGILRDSHVSLRPGVGLVSYASSCGFRGHQVPHLVVQASGGPVTVMVLPHEALAHPVKFDERGYRGTLVPVPGHGSLAVLEKGSGVDPAMIDEVTVRVLESIDWTD